jgi:hypothetical protein
MSSPQQHLSSDDMSMIMRVHDIVCREAGIEPKSPDAERLARLLVREFQHGVSTEKALIDAFTSGRNMKLSVPLRASDGFLSERPGQ